MGKYIDAKYLFKCNTCTHCRNGRCNTYCEHFECYTPDLNLIPAADVVEVVRCKDCIRKVVTEDGEYNPDDIVCDYHMSDGFCENDFCSYGKRKDGAE